jgi:hypothetical protein
VTEFDTQTELPAIKTDLKAQLFANFSRAAVGVICFCIALLWLPVHMVTPILCGVSVLMMTQASYNAYRVGVQDRRLMVFVKVLVWLCVLLCLSAMVTAFTLGLGAFVS